LLFDKSKRLTFGKPFGKQGVNIAGTLYKSHKKPIKRRINKKKEH